MADSLEQTLAKIEGRIKTKAKSSADTIPVAENVVQLPIWPEHTRGMPNTIARSALFNVRFKKTPRVSLKNHVVAALKGINITYTGEELRQDDETVFLQLLHLGSSVPLGEQISFTPYSFLKEIKWPTSGQNHYHRLAECIERLNANGLKVASDKIRYGGSLIRKFTYVDEATGERLPMWTVWLEPEVIRLFHSNDYSRLEWEQRLTLKKPVAQWLHTFYAGHAKPHPMKVATIMGLCDAATKKLSSFRGTLCKSLDDLVKVGFLESWTIDSASDLVSVVRTTKK